MSSYQEHITALSGPNLNPPRTHSSSTRTSLVQCKTLALHFSDVMLICNSDFEQWQASSTCYLFHDAATYLQPVLESWLELCCLCTWKSGVFITLLLIPIEWWCQKGNNKACCKWGIPIPFTLLFSIPLAMNYTD